jgi:hypothetical protein
MKELQFTVSRKRGQLRARPNIVRQREQHVHNVAMVRLMIFTCAQDLICLARGRYQLLGQVRVLGPCLYVREPIGSHT